MSPWNAIARMQLRAFLNSMRRGAKRDPVPTVISVLVTVGTSSLALLMAAAMLIGFSLGGMTGGPEMLFWTATVYGAAACIFALLASVSGEAAGIADARSLQLFPLSRRQLEQLDLASEFLAPSVLLFIPGFLGMALGAAAGHVIGGRPLFALPAALGVAATFICDVTLVRIVSSWVASGGRRLREWIALIFVTGFVAVAYLSPELENVRTQNLDRVVGALSIVARATWLGAGADLATAGRTTFGAEVLSQTPLGLLLDAAVITAWLVLLLRIHGRVTRRVLDGAGGFHARVAAHRVASARGGILTRLLPAPVLGVASTDLRTMLRVPMMWILLFMPALFGIFIGGRNQMPDADPETVARLAAWTLPFAALGSHVLFSSQLFTNLFGIDRDAATHWLLTPVLPRELFLGKALARTLFGSIQVLAFLGALSLRTPGVARVDILHAYMAWLASVTWVSAAGMILSVRVPVRMTFGQQKEQRFERVATSMLAQLAVALTLLPAAAMIAGGRILGGQAGYVEGIAVTAISGVVIWLLVLHLAGQLLEARGTQMVDGLSSKG